MIGPDDFPAIPDNQNDLRALKRFAEKIQAIHYIGHFKSQTG